MTITETVGRKEGTIMPPHDEDVPNIQACCAHCHFVFDLKFGNDCPRCNHTGVTWARRISDAEYQRERNTLFGSVAGHVLRQRLHEWMGEELRKAPLVWKQHNWTLTEGEQKDVDELYRIHALEDTRDEPKPIGNSRTPQR